MADPISPTPSPTSSATPPAAGTGTPRVEPKGSSGGAAPSAADSTMLGVGQGFMFNYLDEAGAVVDTLAGPLAGDGERESVWNSDAPFTDMVARNQRKNQEVLSGAYDAHPGYYIGGNLVGGAAVPFGAGARTFGEFVKVGAISGAVAGSGEGESLGERAENAATGTAIGAATGGLLHTAGKVVKAGYAKLTGRETTPLEVDINGGTPMSPLEDAANNMASQEDTQVTVGWTNPDAEGNRTPILMDPVKEPSSGAPKETPAPEAVGAASKPSNAEGPNPTAPLETALENWQKVLENGGGPSLDITQDTPEALALRAVRLGRLNSTEQAAQLMQDTVLSLTRKEVRPDTDLAATALNAARLTGSDPQTMQALGAAIAGNLKEADTGMAIFSMLKAKARQEIGAIHLMDIDWSTASPELITTAKEAIHNISVLTQMDLDAATGIGRALRSRRLPDAETYLTQKVNAEAEGMADKGVSGDRGFGDNGAPTDGEQIPPPREVRPLPETPEEIRDFFALWGMMGGNARMQHDYLSGRLSLPAPGMYLRTSFANLFTANILSGPKTIALNVFGPSLISVMKNVERTAGGALGAVNPMLSKEARQANLAVAAEVPRAMLAGFGDIQDAFRSGWLAMKQNRRITGGGAGNPGEMLTANMPLTQALLDAANVKPDWRYSLGNLVNVWPRAFSRLNNGLDEMTTRLSYLGNVRLNAQVEASTRGLEGDKAAAFVQDALKGAIDEAGVATDKAAMEAAERVTLMGTPGQEGTNARTTANWVGSLRKHMPELRYIMPVFNIPANAIGYTLEHTPLAWVPGVSEHLGFSRNIKALKGELGPVQQAEAHGQIMLGAAFLTAGFMMNRSGMLTGAGPQDPADRAAWLETNKPYSIRVASEDAMAGHVGVRSKDGGYWVDYRKIDILGGLLSIPATISDATVYHRDDQGVSDAMWAGLGAMMQWSKDRAAFQNMATLMGVGDDPTKDAGTVASQLGMSVATGLVLPAPVSRTAVDLSDPYVRMKTTWEDAFKQSIPGLSQQVEPQRNIFGEPLERPNDTLAEAFFPVASSPAGSIKKDPVADELVRLYQKTGFGAGGASRALSYGQFDPRQVKLEDGQTFYGKAEQMRMTVTLDGKTLRQTLSDLFDSDEYNAGGDGTAKFSQNSLEEDQRPYMVSKVFKDFNAAIKQELGKVSPKARAYMVAATAKERDQDHLGDLSVEQLVANPSLYATRGIDPNAYAAKVTGDDAQQLVDDLFAPPPAASQGDAQALLKGL